MNNNRMILFIVALVVIMLAGNVLMNIVNHVLAADVLIRLAASGAMCAALIYLFLESCLKLLAVCGCIGGGVGLAVMFAGAPMLEALNLALVMAAAIFMVTRLALFFYEQWQLAGMTMFFRNLFR